MKKISVKRFFQLLSFILIFSLTTPIITPFIPVALATEKTKAVTINFTKARITKNQKIKLKVVGSSGTTTWKTSNSTTATVSKSGVVCGKQFGTATITASINNKKYTAKITVGEPYLAEPCEHWKHADANFMTDLDLVLLDMKNTNKDFKNEGYPINGVYASVYSEKTLVIEGIDSKGTSLGSVTKKGKFYLGFEKAVKLRITNPNDTHYIINLYPVKPLVITKTGTYDYDDFTWHKLKDGNIRAHVVFALENSYINYTDDTEKAKEAAHSTIVESGYLPYNTGKELDPDMMGAWKDGFIYAKSVKEVENLKGLKISVNQYKVYVDESDVFIYGNAGLILSEDHLEKLATYREIVTNIGTKQYFPMKSIWDKPLRIRFHTFGSQASKKLIYISKDLFAYDVDTILHEYTHYFHLESQDYGCLISAWTEGSADALAEEGMKELGADTTYYYANHSQVREISEADLKDFENYFINVGYSDCYAVGYTFIRFIQKEYGNTIMYKINENIQKNIPNPTSDNLDSIMRDAKSDKAFIQCIKDATSEDVFERFALEVAVPILNLKYN